MSPPKVYIIEDGKIYRHQEFVGTYDSFGETHGLDAGLSPAQQMRIGYLVKEKLGLVKRRGRRPKGKPLVEIFAAEAAQAPVLDLTIPPISDNVPPAPDMDPRFGDKTPAFVEWMFKYHPAEARKKYALRRIQGLRMPGKDDPFPQLPKVGVAPIGDLPPGAMEEEKAEQWVRK